MPIKIAPETAYELTRPICPNCFCSLQQPPDQRPDVWLTATCGNCIWTGEAVFVRSQYAIEFGRQR